MLDFALQGINTLSGKRAWDLVNSLGRGRRRIFAESACVWCSRSTVSGARGHAAGSLTGELGAGWFPQAEGNLFCWESVSWCWKQRCGKACVSGKFWHCTGGCQAVLFIGGRNVGLSSCEEREGKKKESFISPPLREAVQIRIHYSCLCWLLFPKLPVAMNWVHSMQISEKLMRWDFSFSMLFNWTMQKHALLQYKYAFRYRWDTKSWQLCRTGRSHLCVWSSHGGSNGELPVNGASQRQQLGTLQLLPKHHLLVWQDFSVTWALIFTWSSNFHLKKCFH